MERISYVAKVKKKLTKDYFLFFLLNPKLKQVQKETSNDKRPKGGQRDSKGEWELFHKF
jgi:hypothetical protein